MKTQKVNPVSKPKATRKPSLPPAFGAEPVVVDIRDWPAFKAKHGLRVLSGHWPANAARPVMVVDSINAEPPQE